MKRNPFILLLVVLAVVPRAAGAEEKILRGGAAAVDVTPQKFPLVVSGGFLEATADRVHDPLHVRCLVLDDGATRVAIVVVDSLMMPRELLDGAKAAARRVTGIPAHRIMISATHTHSAPSLVGALGTGVQKDYARLLQDRIVQSIRQAAENLVPVKVGWSVVQDFEHTHCRRWIVRPDRIETDPFGGQTIRAMMHPGYQSPNHVGPAGPVDAGLSVLGVQTPQGQPLALLANYSMHYFGAAPVSADYYGRFVNQITRLVGEEKGSPFVAMMSQGTSGDLHWMDYGQPHKPLDIDTYSREVAEVAYQAYQAIEYHDWVPLAMRESKLTLERRVPNEERLAWAQGIVDSMGDRKPQSQVEVYALEQLYLHREPVREMKIQAMRIGGLGITAVPCEVYGITGLKIKAQSPLQATFNLELANGAEGYIPPPEQHHLGGYTTWPARSAGLEVQAEPKIVDAVLALLEEVAEGPRRKPVDPLGPYAKAVLASSPVAYWRMGEFNGPTAADASNHANHGSYEPGVAYYLPGPAESGFSDGKTINRSAHFAGGRMRVAIEGLGNTYSVEMCIYNGLPADARAVTGYFLSRGIPGAEGAPGDHLGIGGTHLPTTTGQLIVFNGNRLDELLVGNTTITLRTWNHVVFVRDGKKVDVFLNGNPEPEISGEIEIGYPDGVEQLLIGGRNDDFANFEGKIDEVAVYDRVLSAEEIVLHYRTSAMPPRPNQPPPKPGSPPLSPAESLRKLHVPEGFDVELVAAEPLVVDPVAIAFGADGKLWVVEMADYPLGMDGRGKPGGRIRWLEDTNHDGRYDRSVVFLDGVRFPNGILPWHRGVLVTAAPEIFYAEDTDGDGKADLRETLFHGFAPGNPQLRINGLRRGLDHWIYCANGWSGGQAVSVKTGAKIDLGGRDLRIRPDEGLVDAESGVSQFGRNRDDWDDWFGVNNSYPMWHYVLADHYTRRNPHVVLPDPKVQLILPPNPTIYPRSPILQRFNTPDQAGRFTSACQAMVYRDELLFKRDSDQQHAFICEPVHNLVHHEILTEEGVSFAARRPDDEQDREFFASEDKWCRPVMTRTGPDGALWVVDMYRWVNEHPEWIPKHLLPKLDLRAGDDRGRIYRVVPKHKRLRPIPRLDERDSAELVAVLESPNGWQRDTAGQLLIERNDPRTVDPLERLSTHSKFPLARLHALCTLDGMGRLKSPWIERALHDPHPGVRRHAVRLAESAAAHNSTLISAAARLVDDPHPRVRLQLACSLGQWNDPRAAEALGRLLVKDHLDSYISAGAMSSVGGHNLQPVVKAVLRAEANRRSPGPATRQVIGQLLAVAVAFNRDDVLRDAVGMITEGADRQCTPGHLASLAGLLDALRRSETSLAELAAAATSKKTAAIFDYARKLAEDSESQEDHRILAIALLGRGPDRREEDLRRLSELLVPQQSGHIQSVAVEALARLADPRVPEVLLLRWRGHALALRAQILDVLLSRQPWAEALLDAIESRTVMTSEIDAARRERLRAYKNPAIRTRAAQLLAGGVNPDRKKLLQQFQSVLQLVGNRRVGPEVFKKNCANCHRFQDEGFDVGPDLAALTDKSPQTLLKSILDPNDTIDSRYLNYVAITDEGLSYSGLLSAETSSSITLTDQDGKKHVLLRAELEALESTGKSHMPEGLEEQMARQELADLIAYVGGASPTRK